MRGRRGVACALALAASCATTSAVAVAVPRTTAPHPGTAAQVQAAVAFSSRITTVPSPSFPWLGAEGVDSASREFPATSRGCLTATACVFGDPAARRTIFLYGDSHAQMWLSAVAPAAAALHYRVVLMFLGGCPFADVTVWNPIPIGPFPAGFYHACDWFRFAAIQAIRRLKPALVLLSNRTAMVMRGPGSYFSRAQWRRGVVRTIAAIRRTTPDVAVIGDIVFMSNALPQCLAAEPTHVQACASPNPNLAVHGHEAAEGEAARAAGARFIDTLPWVCTQRCSPVIGPFLVYLNGAHLDATYVTYLSRVMQARLVALLR